MARKFIPIAPYIAKLEQAIGIGATYDLAALYAGISPRTFARWRSQAAQAKDGTPLAELRDRLAQAEGRAAIGWLAVIERAASSGDWRAAAYKLQARYPDQYGPKVQATLAVNIQAMAARVAEETGLDAQAIVAEAQALLHETDTGHH
jgi:hypothetical protein